MNYSLTHSQEKGQPGTLTLSGHLTIKNSFELHAQLLKHAQEQQGMRLEVKEVEEFDMAFLQLLLSLSKYQEENKKSFYLQLDLLPFGKKLLKLSGIDTQLNTKLQ